jgi:hypothetical protein
LQKLGKSRVSRQINSDRDQIGKKADDLFHLDAVAAGNRHADDNVRFAAVLSRGPLVRLVLLRLEPDSHVMLVILHHIICDGWFQLGACPAGKRRVRSGKLIGE